MLELSQDLYGQHYQQPCCHLRVTCVLFLTPFMHLVDCLHATVSAPTSNIALKS